MNKNFKIALKITLLLMVLAISVLSGVRFKFPETWKFSTNILIMSRTFLNLAIGITFLRIPYYLKNMYQKKVPK